MVNGMPSSRLSEPKVMRGAPDWLSMPITQSASPISSEVKPRVREVPITAEIVVKARIISEKYSVGPKVKASSAKVGARKVKSTVPIVPATNDPTAAVANAEAPRPLLAIRLPSIAVTIELLSPGVFRRMDVVDPPYIAP